MNDSITYQSEYGTVHIDLLGIQALETLQEAINEIRNNLGVPESFFRSRDSHIRRIIGENKIEDVDWMKEGF